METSSQQTLLIIEDEVALHDVLIDRFTSEGYNVLEAMDGERGLELALEKKPDLILLNLLLPKMDGMTVLRKMRDTNAWGKEVPVIVLTNLNPDDEIIKTVNEDQPAYYLVKSDWPMDEIVKKVKELLP